VPVLGPAAVLAELVQQMAEIRAELQQEEAPEPAVPPIAGREQLGPEGEVFQSAEEAAAASGPWSPEFAAWREAHIAPTSRGIFQ